MHIFNFKNTSIIAAICFTVLFDGCQKAPDEKLAAAKAAIHAAREAEADTYMSKNFQNLEKALKTAEGEIAKQKQSFVLTRKYKRITDMLEKTAEMATELKNEAPKIKADMINQLKENLGLVSGMLEETANDIKKARRRQSKSVIAELKADLAMAESTAALASTEFDAGNYFSANEKLEEVQGLIKKITDTLNPKSKE